MEAWGHLIQENKRGAPLVTEERGERERETDFAWEVRLVWDFASFLEEEDGEI